MDETARYRHQLRRRISSKIKKYVFGNMLDDGSDDEGSMKLSMHGRLMVQPSRMVLDIEENVSFNADEEEKRRAETQYRLTTQKRVSDLVSSYIEYSWNHHNLCGENRGSS